MIARLCVLFSCFALLSAQNLGVIDFPTSGSGEARKHFVEGVLYLHNFEFEDAEEQFRKARELDPDFAMAYWGEAMTHNHPLWRQVDVEKARNVLNELAPTPEERLAKAPTEREKDYLRAVEALYGPGDKAERDRAYHEAMRRMYEKYPEDLEAAAFYSLSWLGLGNGTRDFREYMRGGAIAEEVFAKNPKHPGAAHYMIHSYDDPIHAPLGLRPARVYAQIAPAASHAQHMVSHIFVAMGMWEESAAANEKSFEVADERVRRKGLGVDDRNFHALLWLHYGYLQQGRLEKAREVLEVMKADTAESGSRRTRYHLARMKAAHVVETRGQEPVEVSVDHEDLDDISVATDLYAEVVMALGRGELKKAESFHGKMGDSDEDAARVLEREAAALIQLKNGDSEKAVELLRQATSIEEAMPLGYGPPVPVKPSHELLGELLLQLGRHDEARRAFEEALKRAPGRALSVAGLTETRPSRL